VPASSVSARAAEGDRMQIITWDPKVADYRHSDEPNTCRLTPHAMLRTANEAAIGEVDRDAEAVIMPAPYGRVKDRTDEESIQWLRDFAWMLRANRKAVRWVWMDHPPNDWRIDVDGDLGDRRHPAALSLFARGLREFAPIAACQYGVIGGWDGLPQSPVIWSEEGTARMYKLKAPRLMPWVRGIGQWAPSSPAPTMRSFLHDLLACWRKKAECVLVWSDPARTTETQLEQMAQCIDIVQGMRVDIRDEPADDMGRLLSTLAGGGNFRDIIDVLASWGGTGGEIDPDLGGGA